MRWLDRILRIVLGEQGSLFAESPFRKAAKLRERSAVPHE
jgi:hypothetical protein